MTQKSTTSPINTASCLFFIHWMNTVIADIHGKIFDLKDVVEEIAPDINDTYKITWKNGNIQNVKIEGRTAKVLIDSDLWGPCFTIVGLCYPTK